MKTIILFLTLTFISVFLTGCNVANKILKQPQNQPTANILTPYHDVKYYFDNLETFNENHRSLTIENTVVVRGKLIITSEEVLCLRGPCPPENIYFLQDINDARYKIFIYSDDLVKTLKPNNTYTLKGILKKGLKMTAPFEKCNKNLCKFVIELFKISEIIQSN